MKLYSKEDVVEALNKILISRVYIADVEEAYIENFPDEGYVNFCPTEHDFAQGFMRGYATGRNKLYDEIKSAMRGNHFEIYCRNYDGMDYDACMGYALEAMRKAKVSDEIIDDVMFYMLGGEVEKKSPDAAKRAVKEYYGEN